MPPSSSLPDTTDVVVVGGGVMGTSAAFFLASDSPLNVSLLEKDNIAAGSTGDSSAILRHHYGDQRIYAEMAWWSHEFYRAFEERTGQKLAHAESPLVRFAASGTQAGKYAEAGYEVLSDLDIPTTRYDRDDLAEEYPMFDALEQFDFAISDDDAGYSDGADAANGFARAARRHGATVVTDTTVERIQSDGNVVTGVETGDGIVECDAVVIAAGTWTARLAATVGVDVPITPTREQVVLLDPPEEYAEEFPELTPTTALPGGEWYVRPDFGDGILVATHYLTEECDPDHYDRTPDEEVLLELTDRIANAVSGLEDAGIQGQYCGVYSVTPDHDFVIDRAGPEGCVLACGFSGHGFKHAPAVGRIVRDLVVEGDTDLVDADFFSLDRFEDDPSGHGLPADNI